MKTAKIHGAFSAFVGRLHRRLTGSQVAPGITSLVKSHQSWAHCGVGWAESHPRSPVERVGSHIRILQSQSQDQERDIETHIEQVGEFGFHGISDQETCRVPRLWVNRRGWHSNNIESCFNQLKRWTRKRCSCLPRASCLSVYLSHLRCKRRCEIKRWRTMSNRKMMLTCESDAWMQCNDQKMFLHQCVILNLEPKCKTQFRTFSTFSGPILDTFRTFSASILNHFGHFCDPHPDTRISAVRPWHTHKRGSPSRGERRRFWRQLQLM